MPRHISARVLRISWRSRATTKARYDSGGIVVSPIGKRGERLAPLPRCYQATFGLLLAFVEFRTFRATRSCSFPKRSGETKISSVAGIRFSSIQRFYSIFRVFSNMALDSLRRRKPYSAIFNTSRGSDAISSSTQANSSLDIFRFPFQRTPEQTI